jgi:hypothetical protein
MISLLRTVCSLATIVVACASYLSGFGSCGATERFAIATGYSALIGLVTAIAAWWYIAKLSAPNHSRYYVARQTMFFSVAVLLVASISNAAGWVTYYTPRSLTEATREFGRALIESGCP